MFSLNPKNWGRPGTNKRLQGQALTRRQVEAMGPATSVLSDWVFREVAPRLYEALREAVPPIDAAINRLVTLDGILAAEAETDALQRELDEFIDGVPVNDFQEGLQAAYAGQGNEMYEQGFGFIDFTLGERGIDRLHVGDSKGYCLRRNPDSGELEVWFRTPSPTRGRRDGTDQIERVLRNSYATDIAAALDKNGYRRIDRSRLVYAGLQNEADNPYGVSIMRSMEFCSRVLLTMDNAQLQTWERFGNPVFKVNYKTKSRQSPTELESRRKALADNLKDAMEAKRKGNAVDFVNAIGANDELEITVLGGDGQVLELEAPARHILEQIVAKTGLPSWLLGFHWSTAERLAERQGEILLQESRTRFSYRKPGLRSLLAAHLRQRGITWNPGDWDIVQELPSLQDIVAMAQAGFLEAQTEMMRSGAGTPPVQGARTTKGGKVVLPTDEDYRADPLRAEPPDPLKADKHAHARHGHKQEDFVEADPELPQIEADTEQALLSAWSELRGRMAETLGLPANAKQDGAVFIFDPASMMQPLLELEDDFVNSVGAEDAPFASGMYKAWVRGVMNAAAELDADALEDAVRETNRQALATRGLDLVRNASARTLRADIIDSLADGVFDGQNPRDVARALRKRFEAHDVDWIRLARSEISQAQATGKMDQYQDMEIELYDWRAPPDGCPICQGREAAGPYSVGGGPLPMRDSHPNCRCTVVARTE